ncbi:MAG: metallophosphoesterase [Pseudomonadota bacterium]
MRIIVLLLVALITTPSLAGERDGVARVVVVGDVHGDYKQFVRILRDIGVIDKRTRWRGGKTHLVQIGDLPDRGPDTDRVIRMLKRLEKEAERAGGEVHVLVGNHEAMVMRGDLRYVHPNEYAALTDNLSRERQKRYYEKYVEWIKRSTPEDEWPEFNREYWREWSQRFPLGYTEHRQAWAPDGEFGGWVLQKDALLRINDSLFVHAGLDPSAEFQPMAVINKAVRGELANARESDDESIINAADSPLWYRGLAVMPETDENIALVDGLLDYYGVKRIIIGHTPLMGTILPRFGGRVLLTDVGMAEHYGSGRAALIIDQNEQTVVLGDVTLEMPAYGSGRDALEDYLAAAKPLVSRPEKIDRYLEKTRPELINSSPDSGAQ